MQLDDTLITETIVRAREILSDPARFSAGDNFARDAGGQSVNPNDTDAASFCARGAFCVALKDMGFEEFEPHSENEGVVSRAFAEALGIGYETRMTGRLWWKETRKFFVGPGAIGEWNMGRDHASLLAGFDEVIAARQQLAAA